VLDEAVDGSAQKRHHQRIVDQLVGTPLTAESPSPKALQFAT
jgi:hypothetical protein